jgi:hypothetical protein
MNDLQKLLTHFISFNSHPHADNYNTVEGIISPADIKEDLNKTMGLLKKDYVFIDYNPDLDPDDFLKKLIQSLTLPKTVFIFTTSLKLNPVIFDQLSNFRRNNSFSLATGKINPEAKLFMVLSGEQNKEVLTTEMYELTDHVLDMRGGIR